MDWSLIAVVFIVSTIGSVIGGLWTQHIIDKRAKKRREEERQ